MKKTLEMMKDMELNSPLDKNILHSIESEFKVRFSKPYSDFMQLHNGGEGPIGEYGYLAIWDVKELRTYNHTNMMKMPLSNLFYFASDRGGTMFAFDTKDQTMKIVEIQEALEIKNIANTFDDFINYIYNIDDSEYE